MFLFDNAARLGDMFATAREDLRGRQRLGREGKGASASTLYLTLPVWYLHLGRGGVAADFKSCAVDSVRGFPRFWMSLLPGVSIFP